MKKSRWRYIFVAEPIIDTIEILRTEGLHVIYNNEIDVPGLAMGYFQDNSGLIQSCEIWLKKDSLRILKEKGKEAKTCILLYDTSFQFLKISRIVKKSLTIIDNTNCKFEK